MGTTWADLIADPEAGYDLVGWWWYGGGHLPYWFTLDDGVVVQVQEQYPPDPKLARQGLWGKWCT
jgi:hypothetical protein